MSQSLVLWSGGCDSTMALYDEILKKNQVRAVSIVHPQLPAVAESKKARAAIKAEILRRKLSSVEFYEINVADGHPEIDTNDGPTLPQPMLWIGMVMPYLKMKENLILGYVRGDDVWHRMNHFTQAFSHLQSLAQRTGALQLPLEWTRKEDVITYLRKKRLMRHVWWCECPKKSKPCGRCSPCTSNAKARWWLRHGRKPLSFSEMIGQS